MQFNLPVIYRAYGYGSARGSESGIGDSLLIGNINLYEKLKEDVPFRWTAVGGVKFPTGDTSKLDPNLPDFAPGIAGHDLALGSGSSDGLLGTGFYARWQRLFVTGSMEYAVRSEACDWSSLCANKDAARADSHSLGNNSIWVRPPGASCGGDA